MDRKRQRGTARATRSERRGATTLETYRRWLSSLSEVLEEQRPGVDVLLDRMVRRRMLARDTGPLGR